jgi:hypothetical protein
MESNTILEVNNDEFYSRVKPLGNEVVPVEFDVRFT